MTLFSFVQVSQDLNLAWKSSPYMPAKMSGFIQCVVEEEKVYIGGGSTGFGDNVANYKIMTYDTASQEWDTLLPYRAESFGMTAIDHQLVLVGGIKEYSRSPSNLLGVWRADRKKWTHPYPEMPTARSHCSAVVHNEWLVVAGGKRGLLMTSSVEVLNVTSSAKQWYTAAETPVEWHSMKTATVGGACYFLGGYTEDAPNSVYSMSIQKNYGTFTIEWSEMTELPMFCSSPISAGGHLFAMGGLDENLNRAVSIICVYRHDIDEWVKIGSLLSPRYDCTCTMITDRVMIVAGGSSEDDIPKAWMENTVIDSSFLTALYGSN